jgi:thermitase
MLTRWLVSFSLAAGLLSLPQTAPAQPAFPHGSYIAGELLIAPKAGVSEDDLENLYKSHGGKKIKSLSKIKVHHIKVPEKALDAIEAALQKNPKIEFVERNVVGYGELTPNDPGFPSQWHLPNIWAPSGWNVNTGSSSIVIAVIDSGVDSAHPDLSSNLVAGYNFLSDNTNTNDVQEHGTAVAGAAAAAGNSGIGVAGVSWKNKIMPLVVLNSSNVATVADVSQAIIYAADHGAKVINLSLAFTTSSTTMTNAINYAWNKGLVVVAAAGNYNTSTAYYPAANANVLAVSATDKNNVKTSFSNFGSWIDVAAPGIDIYTTKKGGGYWWCYGTSLATPQVAALAALVFSTSPGLTNTQVVDLIKKNTTDLGAAGFDTTYGWGKINVSKTLNAALLTPALATSIDSPTDGSSVSGTVIVDASATSEVGISKVDLYVNNVLSGTQTAEPFAFAWNTSGLSGWQVLTTKAYDVTGNVATSAPVDVNVASADTTPPTVSITSVSMSRKFMTVTASASDAGGSVVKVELYVDGALKSTDSSSPYSFKINIRAWPKGSSHNLYAKAYDAAGNVGTSTSMTAVK